MNPFVSVFWTVIVLASACIASETVNESIQSRIHRELGNGGRKLIEVTDPSIVLDGQFIIMFDPDTVMNVTEKTTQLFTKEQIVFQYDNIAIKGVAIRSATTNLLNTLEADPHVLFIQPVRRNMQRCTLCYFLRSNPTY
jgi:hypothetical protein